MTEYEVQLRLEAMIEEQYLAQLKEDEEMKKAEQEWLEEREKFLEELELISYHNYHSGSDIMNYIK